MEDIEIAQENEANKIQTITAVAGDIGLDPTDIEQYGPYKAKITTSALERLRQRPQGKLVLVTAINLHQRAKGSRPSPWVSPTQCTAKVKRQCWRYANLR